LRLKVRCCAFTQQEDENCGLFRAFAGLRQTPPNTQTPADAKTPFLREAAQKAP